MKKSTAILLGWAVLLPASQMFQPCVAVAANECVPVCTDTAKDCFERVKGTANEISDMELCQKDKVDCLKKCIEEIGQQREENERQRLLQDQENENQRILKEQEQKAVWDSQGLTLEQQEAEKRRLQEEKRRLQEEEQEQRYHPEQAPQEQ